MARLTIEQLKKLKESEDKVEFKRAEQGNFETLLTMVAVVRNPTSVANASLAM